MKAFDIYLIGVGGQGVGLLSEVMIRAADYAGFSVRGVDTHGLAQRGGIVVSHVRIGDGAHSPIIQENCADLVVALEINEALRGLNTYLKDGGTLIYYDARWQHLATRLGKAGQTEENTISDECALRGIKLIKVFREKLEDSRMENVVVLAELGKCSLVPGVETKHYEMALKDMLADKLLEKNLEVFHSIAS